MSHMVMLVLLSPAFPSKWRLLLTMSIWLSFADVCPTRRWRVSAPSSHSQAASYTQSIQQNIWPWGLTPLVDWTAETFGTFDVLVNTKGI